MTAAVAVALTLLVITPCRGASGRRDDPSPMTQKAAPAPRTIDKGDQSNIDARREVVVRTSAEWRQLWQQHSPDRPVPPVDFSKEMVVGVFLGSRPTAGYGVAIVKAINANGILSVQYQERAPGRDAITAQILTSPYHLAAIPKSPSLDVKFEQIRP